MSSQHQNTMRSEPMQREAVSNEWLRAVETLLQATMEEQARTLKA